MQAPLQSPLPGPRGLKKEQRHKSAGQRRPELTIFTFYPLNLLLLPSRHLLRPPPPFRLSLFRCVFIPFFSFPLPLTIVAIICKATSEAPGSRGGKRSFGAEQVNKMASLSTGLSCFRKPFPNSSKSLHPLPRALLLPSRTQDKSPPSREGNASKAKSSFFRSLSRARQRSRSTPPPLKRKKASARSLTSPYLAHPAFALLDSGMRHGPPNESIPATNAVVRVFVCVDCQKKKIEYLSFFPLKNKQMKKKEEEDRRRDTEKELVVAAPASITDASTASASAAAGGGEARAREREKGRRRERKRER